MGHSADRVVRRTSGADRQTARYLHGARLSRRAHLHGSYRAARREAHLPSLRHRRDARDGGHRLRGLAARLQPCGAAVHLPDPAAPGPPAAQPGPHPRHEPDRGLQHRGQLHDQHELAGLRTGDGGELPVADARPRPRELRVGRRGHGGGRRVHPRHHAPLRPRARQLLGRHDPQLPLRPAADLDHRGAVPGLAGGRAEPERADPRGDGAGHGADHRPGALRLARDHQGAGQQRRRFLQRQLVAPLREPYTAHQHGRDAGAAGHPGELHLHVRPLRRQPATGLGGVRGRHGDPAYGRDRDVRQRAEGQPDPRQARRQRGADLDPVRRQHGGQRGALRHRRFGPVCERSRPTPRPAPSTTATTA